MRAGRKFSVQYKREAAATRVAPSPQASLRGQWARLGEEMSQLHREPARVTKERVFGA